jgi:hypothetical protein
MDDKQFERFLAVVAILFVAWWLFHRRARGTVAPDGTPIIGVINDPELITYAANPAAFGPQTVNGSVDINVSGNVGLASDYVPLFGFVGMAQGELYQ